MSSDFHSSIQKLNTILKQKQPEVFNPSWIKHHEQHVYKYLSKNIRTETGTVDWDSITVKLDRTFQKRWQWQRTKNTLPYENKQELNSILMKYQSKLYTLLTPLNEEDKNIQDQIFISLVRIAQKGNVLAQKQIIEWCNLIIQEWTENSLWISRWKGYTADIEIRIEGCIRCYRYTGTFIGYLFRTFQYSARGLRPILSLDKKTKNRNKTLIDFIVQDYEY